MKTKNDRSSWIAFGLFYTILMLIVTILDIANDLLRWSYWGTQAGLVTVGVGIFALIGRRTPDLSAIHGILLAFTVGILTIIPAVLMGMGRIPGLWPQYFYIAFGMATGSFLTFLSLKLSQKLTNRDQSDSKGHHVD